MSPGCGFRLDPGLAFAVGAAHLLDMHEQIGEPALDGFKMAEPRIGRIKPLH